MLDRVIQGFCAGVCLAGIMVVIGAASVIAMPVAGLVCAVCVGR